MKRIEELNYYELLNLDKDAGVGDIQQAYLIAVSTYSRDSLAAHSVLSEEEKTAMLKRIEAAYTTLVDKNKRLFYDKEVLKIDVDEHLRNRNISEASDKLTPHTDYSFKGVRDATAESRMENEFKHTESTIFGGAHLKNIREMKGITIDEIAQKTRIRASYLKALEGEDFEQLPAEVFLRGFLKAYAKYLGLDPDVVSRNYKFRNK
jgi:DnaJ-class molecular chaperone